EAGGAKPPAIVPRGSGAKLIVEHTFQHAAEAAIFETSPNPVYVPDGDGALDERPSGTVSDPVEPGVGFVPARKSRVVFDLTGETVEFTTQGILDAMTRLPLVLADLAKPGGSAPTRGSTGDAPLLVLPPILLPLGEGL